MLNAGENLEEIRLQLTQEAANCYKSLYAYCVERLNLTEGAVPARVHVANVSRRFPQILVALAEGRISLTVASLLAPHVREDNVDKLISRRAPRACRRSRL